MARKVIASTRLEQMMWAGILFAGNYERYLRQIDANSTSAGYWNIDAAHNDVMYGRFGRGFDLAKGKDALYFDIDDAFFRNAPLKKRLPPLQ